MTICTIFNAKLGYNKFPVSPTNDNKFTFTNLDVKTNLEFYRVIISHFTLNIPLIKLPSKIIEYRRKNNLIDYYSDYIDYIFLDIDCVKNKKDQNKIIEFFKEYKCIIGESFNCNNLDNFDMVGVMFSNPIKIREFKYVMCEINNKLKDYCTINPSASRMATYNSPIMKDKIIINKENEKLYNFDRSLVRSQVNIIKEAYEYSKIFMAENAESKKLKSTLNREFVEMIKNKITNHDTIEDLCLSFFSNMGFEFVEENDDNALVFKHFSEENSTGGYFWFKRAPYTMNHYNILKTVNIFDIVKQLPQSKELLNKPLDYSILLSHANNAKKHKTIIINEKYITINKEIEDSIQEFLYNKECNLFKIKSAMGTGKSTVINHIINEAHFDDLSVLIITNRISVADDFNEKYKIKIYNKDLYHIGDSLICQYDSLWKYNMQYFDIVIMDEFVSVLLHSRSSLNKSTMNTNKFFKSFNKKVVIADAFLTGYEHNFFNNKKHNHSITIQNDYRDDTKLISYKYPNKFVQQILNSAKVEKITVSSTSTTFIKLLEMLLYKYGISVTTLTADTSQFSKDIIYNSFKFEDHSLYDVLIYSPTLTVGISNLNKIDKHFHYDSSRSTDVISSLQMIKRTRKTSEIHYYIKHSMNYAPLTYNILSDEYKNKIGKNIEQNNLFEYDDYGNPKISKIGKSCIYIDVYKNIIEYSHAQAFDYLLSYHFSKPPIINNNSQSSNILLPFKKNNKTNEILNNKMALSQYLRLNELDRLDLNSESVSKSLKNIIDIRDKITVNNQNILEKIINLQIKDNKFIEKCYYWKLVKSISKSNINSLKYIKRLVSKSVNDNNINNYNNLNTVLLYEANINNSYKIKTLNRNSKLKTFLLLCGFKSEMIEVGIRSFVVDNNVDLYCEYINT